MPPEMDLKQRVLVNGEQALAMYTRIERQIARLSDGAGRVGRSAGGALSAVGKVGGAILAPLRWASVALGGAAAGAIAFGGAAIASAGNIEALRTRIEGVTATSEEAARVWRETMAMAAASPFETDELVEARIGLLNIGLTGQSALRSVGDAASVTQRGVSDFVGLLAGMETEPLRRIGISLKRDADSFEFTFRDKMQTVRKVTATSMEGAREALLGIFDVKYGGGMAKFASTWKGVTSTLMDNIKIGMAQIGEGMLPAAKAFVGHLNTTIGGWMESGQLEAFGAKIGARLEDAFVFGKSVLEYGSKVFQAVKESGPEGMLTALRETVGAIGQIMAVSFVNYLQAMGNILSGIGKIMSAAFLEDILQLPFMASTRGKMFNENVNSLPVQEFKDVLAQAGFKSGGPLTPAMEAKAVSIVRGKRMFESGVKDFTQDIPALAGQTAQAAKEIIARATANITKTSGYSGPTFGETLEANRELLERSKWESSESSPMITGARYVLGGDNTTGRTYTLEKREMRAPPGFNSPLGKVMPSGWGIIRIDKVEIKADDAQTLRRELIRIAMRPQR